MHKSFNEVTKRHKILGASNIIVGPKLAHLSHYQYEQVSCEHDLFIFAFFPLLIRLFLNFQSLIYMFHKIKILQ